MYGTIARMKVKPGRIEALRNLLDEDGAQARGAVAFYAYQMDADPNELYISVLFENKDAYVANAESPEMHAQYEKMRELLTAEPEWHDGEIVSHRQF